jgi:hypothetical protein
MLIAYILPLCHFGVTLGFSKTEPPWSVTKIYPLLGFDPFLEVAENDYPDSSIVCAHKMLSRDPSHGICPLTAHR